MSHEAGASGASLSVGWRQVADGSCWSLDRFRPRRLRGLRGKNNVRLWPDHHEGEGNWSVKGNSIVKLIIQTPSNIENARSRPDSFGSHKSRQIIRADKCGGVAQCIHGRSRPRLSGP
jgi:hypothetical protein